MPEYSLSYLRQELYLLRQLEIDLAGTHTMEERRELIRAAIIGRGLQGRGIGRGPDNMPATFAAAFSRLYGQSLEAGKNGIENMPQVR